jgi:hypothetical protein
MREFRYYLIGLLILGFCFISYSAGAQYPPTPKSRPNAAPQVTQETVQTPAVPAPAQVASPAVVVAAPTTLEDGRAWINTGLLGLLTTIGGWIAARGVKTNAPGITVPNGVTDVLKAIKDPDARKALDQRLLDIVQTGISGKAIQFGAGLIPAPGAVAAVTTLQPYIHAIVEDILAKRAAS